MYENTLAKVPQIEELRVEKICLRFGGIQALQDIDLQCGVKEILAIIGPNGAGKTSLFNCLNGFYRPQMGQIFFGDFDITNFLPHKIAKLGIARTFQNIELYTGLTVVDNLMAARHIKIKPGLLASSVYFGPTRRAEAAHRRYVEDIIDFLEIQSIRKQEVGFLPYGLRKRVELGRALALEPRLLLLDEPMAGMNLEETEDIARFIIDIYDLRKLPIIMIEHDMGVVMDIADRIIVLDFGKKIAEGTPPEIKADPRVIKAYLGEKKERKKSHGQE